MWDFPNSPTPGQVWTAPTGVRYTWNGTVWLQGTPGSILTARRGNRVVNPNCLISQENGTTAVTANGGYPVDQWYISSNLTIQGVQGTGQVSPFGTRTALNMLFTVTKGSLAAGDTGVTQQPIEGQNIVNLGWGTANAIPAVVVINAQCDTPGTYTLAIRNFPATQSFTKLLNLTAGWQTFVVPVPACTAGTWNIDNTQGLTVSICGAAGTTFIAPADNAWAAGNFYASPGQANLAAVANKVLRFTDVGLYADPDNTGLPPPWEVPDYATELVKCQRYWQQFSNYFMGNVTTGIQYGATTMTSSMRTTPVISGVNGGASGFPGSAGTFDYPLARLAREQRTSNATTNGAVFYSLVTLNARM